MTLYTIGYEGLDERQFIAHLTRHGVNVVADVRKLPLSRKKGFSKTALKEMLKQDNIEYLNFRDLGAPKKLRDELYQTWNYDRFFEKYLKCIEDKQDILEAIHGLINSGKKISLLCYERNPEQCHRKVVAEQIKKLDGNGLEIKHIRSGKTEPAVSCRQ
ncbi:DUF488 family protein [Desulfosarcina ovata]|uniref:DUF488 domain-containing protein n=1 Tax=Desulfosarcina ovata subsp. ovata TaxID=2752305 RepID=A0A5K8AB87_9BACT|nr:DUF488 domain-containing protein [Desulfosarcina ovata]BBO89776.1 hypothetical protein DSCOOX_29560 [Desulfosarcina ovata subsp. ovata]